MSWTASVPDIVKLEYIKFFRFTYLSKERGKYLAGSDFEEIEVCVILKPAHFPAFSLMACSLEVVLSVTILVSSALLIV